MFTLRHNSRGPSYSYCRSVLDGHGMLLSRRLSMFKASLQGLSVSLNCLTHGHELVLISKYLFLLEIIFASNTALFFALPVLILLSPAENDLISGSVPQSHLEESGAVAAVSLALAHVRVVLLQNRLTYCLTHVL